MSNERNQQSSILKLWLNLAVHECCFSLTKMTTFSYSYSMPGFSNF